ncbi:hypothetical protein [Streptomyces sp. A5-4]|uniref:hypothetical protein n=1 Tax=Streptomyces sp. A5-4 TaxID=3384771 RepID=UPI003DA7F43E
MAAVKAAGQLWARWDPEQFEKLLASYEDLAEDNLEKLIEQHLQEIYDGFPIEHANDVEKLFKEYGPREDEVFGQENGRVFTFKRNP